MRIFWIFDEVISQNILIFDVLSSYMVPKRGLEPPHLAATASKAVVSTNSTTWAYVHSIYFQYFSSFLRKKTKKSCISLFLFIITPYFTYISL